METARAHAQRQAIVGERSFLPFILVFAAAALVYLNSLPNDFIWDDVSLIAQNTLIQSLDNLPRIFSTHYWDLGASEVRTSGAYRPLTVASFALNYAATGPTPWGFRLVNVLLHGLNSVLVLVLSRRLGLGRGAALLAGLLFAVHPVHTEAVVWITGRAELLACLFCLGSLVLFLRSLEGKRRLSAALSWFFFFLALLAKESAVVLAPIIVVMLLAKAGTNGGMTLRKGIARIAPFAVCVLVYFAVRYAVIGRVSGQMTGIGYFFQDAFPLDILLTMVKVMAYYWVLLAFPLKLSAHYDQLDVPAPASLFEPSLLAAVALHLFFAFLLYRLYRNRARTGSVLPISLAWVYLALLPYSHLIRFEWLMGERFLYIPSVGFVISVAALAERVRAGDDAAPGRSRLVMEIALLLVLLLCSIRTVVRNGDWKDEITFFGKLLKEKPTLAGARYSYGVALMNKGRIKEARQEISEVVRDRPDFGPARELLMILDRSGELQGDQQK